MNIIKKILIVNFVLLCANSCKSGGEMTRNGDAKKETWVMEEVLVQLSEIKTELAELKKQQVATNEKLDKLQFPAGSDDDLPSQAVLSAIDLKNQPSATAKVAIIEFTDYQCPFCARHANIVLPQLRKAFVDKGLVHYEIRDFPLEFHPNAKGASIAVNCMPKAQQTIFHDWVFKNPSLMNKEEYITQAKVLGVTEAKYKTCLDNPEIAKAVDADIAYGESLGVSGTPKFFVGKIKGKQLVDITVISGADDLNRFEKEINNKI